MSSLGRIHAHKTLTGAILEGSYDFGENALTTYYLVTSASLQNTRFFLDLDDS